jgi:transposase
VEEARAYFTGLREKALLGLESCGFSQWLERLVEESGHELWVGDAAQIRASVVRQQKTDQRDAKHIVRLLVEQRLPRLWVPSAAERDVRQLLVHRHQRVRMRTPVKNQLHAIALNQGLRKPRQLWTKAGREQLQKLALPPFTARRRAVVQASPSHPVAQSKAPTA